MYLGIRRIRSAGRTSGSIEVTLPPQLQELEGTECRLTVRDGPRPEIVLQPDLAAAQSLFQEVWQRLRLALSEIDDIGEFSPADFSLTLFPPGHWQERPPLAYTDALAVLHQRTGEEGNGHAPDALTRLLAFIAVAGGYRLGLEGALALAFGDAVAYLITGNPAGLGTDFERGMAHRLFWGDGLSRQPLESPLDEDVWRQARPGFRRVYDQFRAWQRNPEAYTSAREKWYRALKLEMGIQVSAVADYLERGERIR